MRIAAAVLALATASAALTATTLPVLAEERQAIVQFSDLNLAAPAGRATLDARVRKAARRVCGPLSSLQVKEAQEVRDCYRSVGPGLGQGHRDGPFRSDPRRPLNLLLVQRHRS